MTATPDPADGWFPLARSEELVRRHVAQAMLLGREIALWRDDARAVNAWENRCPHRGVRLSIGINDGTDLRCRYHGWRFAGGTGQCRFIPAQPDLAPSSMLRPLVYRSAEAHGFVWASLGTPAEPPELPVTLDPAAFTLRSRFIEAPAATVAGQLAAGYRFAPSIGLDPTAAPVDARITRLDRYALMAEADTGGTAVTVLFLLQPVDGGRAVLHGLVAAAPPGGDRLTVRRHHDFRLDLLRDAAEAAASPVRVVR